MADKRQLAMRALIALCAVLAVGEFIIHRHAYFAPEATPLFFVGLGLAALIAMMGGAKLLHRLVSRPSDYYQEGDDA